MILLKMTKEIREDLNDTEIQNYKIVREKQKNERSKNVNEVGEI